jgi:hypothetical protein
MGKKLRLDVDALHVESFDTTRPDPVRGTVQGNQAGGFLETVDWCPKDSNGPNTCQSCPATCITCGDWPSCAATCEATCGPQIGAGINPPGGMHGRRTPATANQRPPS